MKAQEDVWTQVFFMASGESIDVGVSVLIQHELLQI
jgi:hypothetical protein